MNSHLSSEQLERMLTDAPSRERSQHLSGCAQCAGELASLRQVFGNFREAASAAAEEYRRSTSPIVSHKVPRMAWVFAAVALCVSIATPLAVQHRSVAPVVSDAGVSRASVTMSDEALLDSVQDDLSSSVPESLLPLAGTSANSLNFTNSQRKNQ